MATTFKVNDKMEIRCVSNNTRNGFCHRARLYNNGYEIASSLVSYLNRTWESYTFETVLSRLLEKKDVRKLIPEEQGKHLLEAWGKDPNLNGMGALKSLGMAMAMGSILAGDKKEDQIAWKKRMAIAGGLDIPDDFDSLPVEEKERRLNGVEAILRDEKSNPSYDEK